MDTRKICELLEGTIDPTQRAPRELQLKMLENVIGMSPSLLQIVMAQDVDLPVRQAGAIYLKNMITTSWCEPEDDEPPRFHIHEQDRAMIRESIVDAVVLAPPVIRSQLCVCIGEMCRRDFPDRWTSLVDKICVYLQNQNVPITLSATSGSDANGWHGALAALLALVKVYEFRKGHERKPLDEAMGLLLPLVQGVMTGLMQATGQIVASVGGAGAAANLTGNQLFQQYLVMQRVVLKMFHALTRYYLPLKLMGEKNEWARFQGWMEVVRQLLERNCAEFETVATAAGEDAEDEEDRIEELESCGWWKCKKWAMRILYGMLERYGSRGGVMKEYEDFSNFYINTFSPGALAVVFKVLDEKRRGVFVSEKVLKNAVLYLKSSVGHATCWKFIKPHSNALLSDVLYPIMCHTRRDERLWRDDPVEYIRRKYDSLDQETSVKSAESLLNAMCKKRKGVLDQTVQLVTEILNNTESTPNQRDGAFYMIGSVADMLLKKDTYKDHFETVLVSYVFPALAAHPFPFLRARAAWLLSKLSLLKIGLDEIVAGIMHILIVAIQNPAEELPVKVEAAFAINALIEDQHKTRMYIQPHVSQLSVELLQLLRATENDDLTSVLQKIVCSFVTEITPIATQICVHLGITFNQIMEAHDIDGIGEKSKTVVATGLLNTLETVLVVMEDQTEVCQQLEPILLQVVSVILEKSIMEFYEEAFSLIESLTEKQVSADMWKVFEVVYRVIERDGTEYFVEMMPALHNYITVDPDAFLADQNRILALCTVIKSVLSESESQSPGEDAECHAAKLLEVMILQFRHKIQNLIPSMMRLAIDRLNNKQKSIKTSELRVMCLQVLLAGCYHDFDFVFNAVWRDTSHAADGAAGETDKLNFNYNDINSVVQQLMSDADCFLGLHSRKVWVLGLCSLLSHVVNPNLKNMSVAYAVSKTSTDLLPNFIMLFDGLKRAYAAEASENVDSDSEEEEEMSDDDERIEQDLLSSDEDGIDEDSDSEEYLEAIERRINRKSKDGLAKLSITTQIMTEEDSEDDEDDDDYSEDEDGDALECYSTPLDDDETTIDEYFVFKTIMQTVQMQDPMLYGYMTNSLDDSQRKSLSDIMLLADRRRASAQSKEIEKHGGFEFHQQQAPSSFNFVQDDSGAATAANNNFNAANNNFNAANIFHQQPPN